MFEGAQGSLLDIDFGSYPYVTSSNVTSGGTISGSGVGCHGIDGILGIVKSYQTRVGEGAFPTELKDEIGDEIREKDMNMVQLLIVHAVLDGSIYAL